MKITRNGAVAALPSCSGGGPLVSHLDSFATFLASEGYAATTVHVKCTLVAELSRWVKRHKVPLAELDEQVLRQFHVGRRRRGVAQRGDVATTQQLLTLLRGVGCARVVSPPIDRSAVGKLTRDFELFLRSERGLSPSTLINYLPIVRRFLTERFPGKALRVAELCPQDLHHFILSQVQRVSRTYAKLTVTALRSFLRFLLQRGAINTDLAAAVPGVAHWRLSHLPKSLPPEQVERLLESCDRDTPAGQRDYAILLLLARLGLRAGEVVEMNLEDLDWETGEILVHGKGQRLARLPLPKEVGAALAHYLRHVRPMCSTRRVFIRSRAPQRGFASPVAVCDVVRRALQRAGLNPEFKGAHLLRHSLATELLRRGASLDEIGQLLRHQQPTTTQIYAKVDIAALRRIAPPWPGSAS
jgi:site-specific recombinase XerD